MHCTALIQAAKIKNVYYSYSNYVNGQYECGVMKERARDLETDHISFGRMREMGLMGKPKKNAVDAVKREVKKDIKNEAKKQKKIRQSPVRR